MATNTRQTTSGRRTTAAGGSSTKNTHTSGRGLCHVSYPGFDGPFINKAVLFDESYLWLTRP